METRLLGCSHTENPITTTAATTNTRHNTLKKKHSQRLRGIDSIDQTWQFYNVFEIFSPNIACLFA